MISEVDIRDWGRTPTKLIESKDQYEHYLKHHDWLFEFSDDHGVWRKGFSAHAYLMEARKLFDPHGELWFKYEKK